MSNESIKDLANKFKKKSSSNPTSDTKAEVTSSQVTSKSEISKPKVTRKRKVKINFPLSDVLEKNEFRDFETEKAVHIDRFNYRNLLLLKMETGITITSLVNIILDECLQENENYINEIKRKLLSDEME